MGVRGVLLAVIISLFIRHSDSVLCKICSEGYEDLTLCTKVGKCDGESICYTEVNYNSAGQRIIFSGCKSKQECTKLGLITRRKKRDNYQVCASCCESDFCNTQVCGLSPPKGTVECLSCLSVNGLDECGNTKVCSVSENCMTEYRYVGNGRAAYKMGCESSEICRLRDKYVKNFTRRAEPRVAHQDHPMKLQLEQARRLNDPLGAVKRQIADPDAICLSCCNYSFCNTMENCHIKQEAPPNPNNG